MAKQVKEQHVERKYLEDLKQLIDYVGDEYNQKIAYRYREDNTIKEVTFEQFSADVKGFGEYILNKGLDNGTRIAILG